jgi:hypothetical protein
LNSIVGSRDGQPSGIEDHLQLITQFSPGAPARTASATMAMMSII